MDSSKTLVNYKTKYIMSLLIILVLFIYNSECDTIIVNFGNVLPTHKIQYLPRFSYYTYNDLSTTEYDISRYYNWSNFRLLNISYYPSLRYYIQQSNNLPDKQLFIYYVYDDESDLSKITLRRLNLFTLEDSNFIINFNCNTRLSKPCSNILNFKIIHDDIVNTTFIQIMGTNQISGTSYETVFYQSDIKTLNMTDNDFNSIIWSKKLYIPSSYSINTHDFLILKNYSNTCVNDCIYNDTNILSLANVGLSFLYNNDFNVSKKYSLSTITTLNSFSGVGVRESYRINMAYRNNFVFTFTYSKQFQNSWTLYFLDTQKMSTFNILYDNITLENVTFPSWIITSILIDPLQENTFYLSAYFTNYSDYTDGVATSSTLIKIIRLALSYDGSLFNNTILYSSIKIASQKLIIQKYVPLFTRLKFEILPDSITNLFINQQTTTSNNQQPFTTSLISLSSSSSDSIRLTATNNLIMLSTIFITFVIISSFYDDL